MWTKISSNDSCFSFLVEIFPTEKSVTFAISVSFHIFEKRTESVHFTAKQPEVMTKIKMISIKDLKKKAKSFFFFFCLII